MNTDEERQRAVAAIDAQIDALIEDGVPANSSRIRALVAKRAVAQKSKKAIKRSVREARDRQAAAAGGTGKGSPKAGGRISVVPDSAADTKRLQSLPAKERGRIEAARIKVRKLLKHCSDPTAKGVRNAIAECDADISFLINQGVRYDARARKRARLRKKASRSFRAPLRCVAGSPRRPSSSWPSYWMHTWSGVARSGVARTTSSVCSTCGPAEHPRWASESRSSLTRSPAASRW